MPRTNGLIPDMAGSVEQLESWAREFPNEMSAAAFVDAIFAPTDRPRPTPKKLRRGSDIRDGRIGYHEAYYFARQFDKDGPSKPSEFVQAFACEVTGSARWQNVLAISDEMAAVHQFESKAGRLARRPEVVYA